MPICSGFGNGEKYLISKNINILSLNKMKTKTILIILLVSFFKIQAQEKDSLWHSFKTNLDIILKEERKKAYTTSFYTGSSLNDTVLNIIKNGCIEEHVLTYIYQCFTRDSLPNIRDYIGRVFHQIACGSTNRLARRKAISYLIDVQITPKLSNLLLEDFDNNLKQKLMKQFSRQFTEEELNFFAESRTKYVMKTTQISYDYMISDTLKKYQNKITKEEAKEKVFQSEVARYKQKITAMLPTEQVLIIAAQLDLKEAIPFLETYANNETLKESYRKYAVCALTYMGVNDYEQKAVKYFEGDDYQNDIELARFMNNQTVWYAYVERFKSKKYSGRCPVAYRTIREIAGSLSEFPLFWEGCSGESVGERIEIDDETVKKMVDWMETNKGKYELINSKYGRNFKERTF